MLKRGDGRTGGARRMHVEGKREVQEVLERTSERSTNKLREEEGKVNTYNCCLHDEELCTTVSQSLFRVVSLSPPPLPSLPFHVPHFIFLK